jgi:hypothetical protein
VAFRALFREGRMAAFRGAFRPFVRSLWVPEGGEDLVRFRHHDRRNRLASPGVIIEVMSGRPALFALLTTVALLVAGCSSGGGKHASPTTTHATASSTAVTTTTVSPSPVVAILGACPKQDPRASPHFSLTSLNAAVPGLDNRLVPITALNVRICEYNGDFRVADHLVGSALLRPPAAATFEAETNGLPRYEVPPTTGIGSQGPNPPTLMLTFASDTQQVEVEAGFTLPTNGVFVATGTEQWDDALTHYSPRTPLGPTG